MGPQSFCRFVKNNPLRLERAEMTKARLLTEKDLRPQLQTQLNPV